MKLETKEQTLGVGQAYGNRWSLKTYDLDRPGTFVSTVELPKMFMLDVLVDLEPAAFETMIQEDGAWHDGRVTYETQDEARAGHELVVKRFFQKLERVEPKALQAGEGA